MNKVSVLTREMVSEYESLVGRKITPSEYLNFRNQAMMELDSGYSVIGSNVVETQNNIINNQPNVVPMHVVTTETQVPVNAVQPQVVQINEPAKVEPTVVKPVVEPAPIAQPVVPKPVVQPAVQPAAPTPVTQPVVHPMVTTPVATAQDNDPFFSMIDNMSV